MNNCASNRRVLVTYGYHVGEDFAKDVGLEFKKLNLENTAAIGLKGERPPERDYNDQCWIFKEWRQSYKDWKNGKAVYPEDVASIRRNVGAKYGIDLHDSSLTRDWVLQAHAKRDPTVFHDDASTIKYELVGHMGWNRAGKLIMPFIEEWNKAHGNECFGNGCDCYYSTYHKHRSCRANIIALEYYTVLTKLTIDEAMKFLQGLVAYLQSNV